MAWLAVDKDGTEYIHSEEPSSSREIWCSEGYSIELPKGTIEKIIGHPLTFDDEPFKLE